MLKDPFEGALRKNINEQNLAGNSFSYEKTVANFKNYGRNIEIEFKHGKGSRFHFTITKQF